MADIKPFSCVRPTIELAKQVAALPYDVYNRKEACEVVKNHPLSFLNIDRAETQFDDSIDTYDDKVYAKAKELLEARIADGTYETDSEDAYYLYRLTMDGRAQTGIVACASIDDYQNNRIKKHENTREDKELDRIRHVDTCSAQTGPIFLAYRARQAMDEVVNQVQKENPLYDFVADDGISHTVWKVAKKEQTDIIREEFAKMDAIYIADGHHRAASAVKVGLKRREENPNYTGEEEFNYFLSVLFPDNQLMIMDYNRVVKDLYGHTTEEFMNLLKEKFEISSLDSREAPKKKGEVSMYLEGTWYVLQAKPEILSKDPVEGLDVSMLQNHVLTPILGIQDPRTDKRIDFIGGIRGLSELEKRCQEDMKVAFAMYPTSIQELFEVADAKRLMPPKSTWFEPKLRSGLFIHRI